MKEILRKMFTGWMIHEMTWNPNSERYMADDITCMVSACDGNTIEGLMIHFFDYWSNDIQLLAPHFGIALCRDENGKLFIKDDIELTQSCLGST